MSRLSVFTEADPQSPTRVSEDAAEIATQLAAVGVQFERWQAAAPIEPGAPADQVLAAYAAEIERLKSAGGYTTVDVVSMAADHPKKDAFRAKFRSEHTHSEDEVRFFVAGQGLFSLHIGEHVYEVICTQGDLISVPKKTRHWFDMGPEPAFVAIRMFIDPAGWVANYTGSEIASQFSALEASA